MEYKLYNGDCLDVMKTMEDNSVDSIVTDPPYGLSFMNKHWDYDVPKVEIWQECLRVLKPGGHLLSFAGTRTQHRMCVNIEDAGFEIRDMLAWIYGSGFPKSLNISKGIDKKFNAEREVLCENNRHGGGNNDNLTSFGIRLNKPSFITAPSTDLAKKWEGWGTALKPALEPITLARKPLEEKTIVDNVLKYGTGGINIDDSRVESTGERLGGGGEKRATFEDAGGWSRPWMKDKEHSKKHAEKVKENVEKATKMGRFPANLIHDGSDEVEKIFPDTHKAGNVNKSVSNTTDFFTLHDKVNIAKEYKREVFTITGDGGGSSSRFFYCAKTSKKDRGEGNNHPTVKPTKLMQYLVKLITPKDGVCLDPFMGSGSTGKACKLEDIDFIGIDMEEDYIKITQDRIDNVKIKPKLF